MKQKIVHMVFLLVPGTAFGEELYLQSVSSYFFMKPLNAFKFIVS